MTKAPFSVYLHFDGFTAAKIPKTAVIAKKTPHQIPVPMFDILM